VGAHCVKHLVGNSADHAAEGGGTMYNMHTSLATHLLRLAEVYLIFAEAKIGNAGSTSDADALAAYNKVLLRAIPGETPRTSITLSDVWKERRLELALEGDSWYEYVRKSYFDHKGVIEEIKAQKRSRYFGLWHLYDSGTLDPDRTFYDREPVIPNVDPMYDSELKSFVLPFPDNDVLANPRLKEKPREHDISQFKY